LAIFGEGGWDFALKTNDKVGNRFRKPSLKGRGGNICFQSPGERERSTFSCAFDVERKKEEGTASSDPASAKPTAERKSLRPAHCVILEEKGKEGKERNGNSFRLFAVRKKNEGKGIATPSAAGKKKNRPSGGENEPRGEKPKAGQRGKRILLILFKVGRGESTRREGNYLKQTPHQTPVQEGEGKFFDFF